MTSPDLDVASVDERIQKLLYPRSIAIVGASDSPMKLSGRPVDYLKRFGFTGRILPVNPHRDVIQGIPAFRNLDEIEGDIDLAMVMLPADQTPGTIRELGKRGVPAAIIGASGYAEVGDAGARLQKDLLDAISESGIRVLGPNCLGMIGVREGATPTFSTSLDEDADLKAGPVAFLSQSGAFGSFVFNEGQNLAIGFSHFLNTGNEADLTLPELMHGLLNTDETRVLLAYMEGVSDGPAFLEAGRLARRLDKPLVVVKVGRSEAGAYAAQSHTGSLAGEDDVFEGVTRQVGMLRVEGPEPLLDAAQLFATGRRLHGRRLTTISGSGGAGALMADASAPHGIVMAPWTDHWQAKMAAVIPAYGSPKNPIDMTGTLVAEPSLLGRALEVAIAHPDTDMIAVLLGSSDRVAAEFIDSIASAHERTDRPIVVVWTGGSGRPRSRLRDLGIPCYTDPSRAAAALGLLVRQSLDVVAGVGDRPDNLRVDHAQEIIEVARREGRVQLDEYESAQLISAYGIPIVRSVVAANSDQARVAARSMFPGRVALKVLSNKIAHKTEIGGVRLNLKSEAEVTDCADELLRLAREHDPGVRLVVQEMADGGPELIMGIKMDATFGPIVVVGIGGIMVDVLHDSQLAVAPVSSAYAETMIRALQGAKILDAFRGSRVRDVAGAADALSRLSWLAADLQSEIAELDVNPLFVGDAGAGVRAADALAILSARR